MASSDKTSSTREVWYKALELDELPEGRVKTVTCGLETVCMTHYQGNMRRSTTNARIKAVP